MDGKLLAAGFLVAIVAVCTAALRPFIRTRHAVAISLLIACTLFAGFVVLVTALIVMTSSDGSY